MYAFLIATGIVALAEVGDKTQLLAFLLAARFRQPTPIILGILIATLLNHFFAAGLGVWLSSTIPAEWLRWILGASFIGMAFWMLIPDEIDDEVGVEKAGWGVFTTTAVAFFMAEMGDKTQIATVALAAQAESLIWIVAGTTLGMMIANVPAVILGDRIAEKMPTTLVHRIAAGIFLLLGLVVLSGYSGVV